MNALYESIFILFSFGVMKKAINHRTKKLAGRDLKKFLILLSLGDWTLQV